MSAFNGYPFSAVAGQDKAKTALVISAVNPGAGGVLLCGEKGTAKSTLVRGLGELICEDVCELPLNVTEDSAAWRSLFSKGRTAVFFI